MNSNQGLLDKGLLAVVHNSSVNGSSLGSVRGYPVLRKASSYSVRLPPDQPGTRVVLALASFRADVYNMTDAIRLSPSLVSTTTIIYPSAITAAFNSTGVSSSGNATVREMQTDRLVTECLVSILGHETTHITLLC